jgi:nucleotide-binding universal stress UspA family protein
MKTFRRILVPHDFSRQADRALKLAVELARAHRGRLTLLHVAVPPQPVVGLPGEAAMVVPPVDIEAEAGRMLGRIATRAGKGRGAPRVARRVVLGTPADEIVREGRRHDSIIMSTTGRSGLAHLIMGSVAERVVQHATVPVLTLRARSGHR